MPLLSHIPADGNPGRTLVSGNREYLFFSGYAYLGMNHVPAFTDLVKEGIDRYGVSFPSSRISNTRLTLFEEMEHLLAAITGKEASVCFASGFMAGEAARSLLSDPVVAVPGTHPAVYQGNQYFSPEAISGPAVSIIGDAVDIFRPALTDFGFLAHRPWLGVLVDDSHGIGLTGAQGEGVSCRLPVPAIISYSLSKAFNLIGGAVSCTRQEAEQLRKHPAYSTATSLSPALVYAFIQAQALYALQRSRLRANTALFIEMIQTIAGIRYEEALPIFVLPDTISEEKLAEQGILISSFAYPSQGGRKVKRVIINALHTASDLEILAGALMQAGTV